MRIYIPANTFQLGAKDVKVLYEVVSQVIQVQEQIITDLQLSPSTSDLTHLVTESIVQPQGAQLSCFHQLLCDMQHILGSIPREFSLWHL